MMTEKSKTKDEVEAEIKEELGEDAVVDSIEYVDVPVQQQGRMVDVVDDLQGLEQSTDFSKVVERLLSSDDIEMKTDLTQNQINVVSTLYTYAEIYDIIPIKKLILMYMKLQVSKKRASRKEIVDMVKHKTQEHDEMMDILRSLK